MPHHRQLNKPRSLHRQLSGRNSLSTTSTATHAPLPSTLELSLDEWFNRSSSNSSNNLVSSDKSGDPGFTGVGNGNHLTQSPGAAMTTSTLSSPPPTSPPPQPRSSASVPVTTHAIPSAHSAPEGCCPCCQSILCRPWKKMSKVIRKLETESRLAAEIGQSLLQKNEAYLVESNHLKERLSQCEDRKQELEISLDDTERLVQTLKQEKDKWMWQYEKSEKILSESAFDLENTNLRCTALASDLEQMKLEMEKLKLFEYKSHQSNAREDELQSKLVDTRQDLVISRKTKLAMESKYKKLLTQYEILLMAYQDFCQNSPIKKTNSKQAHTLLATAPPTSMDIQQATVDELDSFIQTLLSTNNTLKSQLLDTSMQLDDTRNEMNLLKERHHDIIQGNGQLAGKQPDRSIGGKQHTTITDIDDEIVSDVQHAMNSNGPRQHHSSSPPLQSCTSKTTTPIPQATTSTPVVHHHYHYHLRRRQQNDSNCESRPEVNNADIVPAYCDDQNCLDSASNEPPQIPPTSSPSDAWPLYIDTIITNDNHYEAYYHEKGAEDEQPSPLNNTGNIQQTQHHGNNPNQDTFDTPTLTLSTSSSAPVPTKSNASTDQHHSIPSGPCMSPLSKHSIDNPSTAIKSTPYSTLLSQAKSVLERLHSTDTRILNRRLQRAFDIRELSNMSNAIIQNIIAEVDTMDSRFLWLVSDENATGDRPCNGPVGERSQTSLGTLYAFPSMAFLVNEFSPFIRFIQELLHEICQLSITVNHLQVAYVTKVEENEARVEKEIIGKYHLHSSASNMHGISNKNNSNNGMAPPLAPSTSISAPVSHSSSGTSSPEQINVNPAHWLSVLFAYNIDIDTLEKTSTTRSTIISTSNDNNDDDGRTTERRQKKLTNGPVKTRIRKKPNHYQQLQQRHQLDRSIETQNHKQLWPNISSIMDERNQTTIKNSLSSSLDREWLLELH